MSLARSAVTRRVTRPPSYPLTGERRREPWLTRRTALWHVNGSVTVRSFAEFGYELICIVPYAFWHQQRGLLASTVGVVGSAPSFFFSPAHTELGNTSRHQDDDPAFGIERGVDGLNHRNHNVPFQLHKWSMPPFASHYGRHPLATQLRRQYPRLCIVHNKRSDWPVNPSHRAELDEVQLGSLLGALSGRGLRVLYICTSGDENGRGYTHDMRDGKAAVRRKSCHFDRVLNAHGALRFQDVLATTGLGWNEAHFAVHAAARWFVSCQGGTAIISSLFGGANLIYDVWPRSGERSTDEYHRLHATFSNASIRVATTFGQLLQLAGQLAGGAADTRRLRRGEDV